MKNLVPYDPIFNTIVPPDERSTREELARIITSYFKVYPHGIFSPASG